MELEAQNVHPTFHVSLLKPHVPNDDNRFPSRDDHIYYDFGCGYVAEQEVDEILAQKSGMAGHSDCSSNGVPVILHGNRLKIVIGSTRWMNIYPYEW